MHGEHSSLSQMPILLLLGVVIIIGYYFGRNMRFVKLPSIIGFMLFGVLMGPSLLNIFTDELVDKLNFIPDIALGFVALSIGMELKVSSLKKLGKGIIYIILIESFGAFVVVFGSLYLLTHNLILSLLFASIAPASAPAGTVAVIQEFKAKGPLTKALYAVVGFDDGLGIIIFGFALAIAQDLLLQQTGAESASIWMTLLYPFKEVIFSMAIGAATAWLLSILSKRITNPDDILIITVGFIFVTCGLSILLHLSLILTNMVIGMFIVNVSDRSLVTKIQSRLSLLLPLLFIMFFTLAGASLHVSALPALGVIGVVYVVSRSVGLISGSRLGAIIGKSDKNIKNYLGLGILSQAGVAIGLSLMIKQSFKGMGKVVETVNGVDVTSGEQIGAIIITTVTATCIFFEIIGPILTRIALKKAGEIS